MARKQAQKQELNLDPDEDFDDWTDVPARVFVFDRSTRRKVDEISDEEVADALVEARGLIAHTASGLNCPFQPLKHRIYNDPDLYDLYTMLREYSTDTAELGLMEAIDAKRPWAIKMRLERIGRDRGYGDRLELTGKDGDALNIVVDLGLIDADDNTDEDPDD